MDLSKYYEEFQTIYNLGIVALCLMIFAVLFIGVRRIINKEESLTTKIVSCILLLMTFAVVLNYFLMGPALAKKDIEQQTILCYEGKFEIIETSHGIYDKAVFLINGEEIRLKYSNNKDEDYKFEDVKIGKYIGQIIYAKNAAQVLKLEIVETLE